MANLGSTVSENAVAHNAAIVHRPCKIRAAFHPASTLNRFLFCPMASLQQITFELRGEFITLDSLLKATGVAESGGRAKTMVAEGLVQVNGQDELRKTAKIRAGQVVSLHGVRIRVVPEGAADMPEAGS